MKKLAILTFSGLACGAIGIFIGYLFLKSINSGANIIFLILSLIFLIISIICLYLVTNPRKSKVTPIADPEKINAQTASIIEQNNSVMTQWSKTIETRDRLKILKIAGAQDEKNETV